MCGRILQGLGYYLCYFFARHVAGFYREISRILVVGLYKDQQITSTADVWQVYTWYFSSKHAAGSYSKISRIIVAGPADYLVNLRYFYSRRVAEIIVAGLYKD